MEEPENKELIDTEKDIVDKVFVFAIAANTIGIEIDPEAYKRYNNDDKNVGS